MTDVPRIGASRVVTKPDGTYTPDPAGEWAAVLGVMGFTHEPVGFYENGSLVWDDVHNIVDLVAWYPEDPGRWWLRRGTETLVIGVRELRIAAYFNDPIMLHETPEAWAIAVGRGVCVLNWDMDLRDLFDGVSAVRCKTLALRARFQAALRRREPKLTVSQVEVDYAA